MSMNFLVIGSGIAGLSFALRVAEFGSVIVVTKKEVVDTATNLAQGGIAAVLDLDTDSVNDHINDTMVAGSGLCDFQVVSEVVRNGYQRVNDLVSYGVEFIRDCESGAFNLGREGGHSHRRVAHAYDLTGRAIEHTLLERARSHPSITLLENHMVVDLVVVGSGSSRVCRGAYVYCNGEGITTFEADQTILCTGGVGKVYLYTSNPDIATGDGVAVAYRAGACVANMEFVQFHPTCLYHPRAKNFLISEAVRGEGAVLLNKRGERFMIKYDPRKELATRDMVARSIDREMKESGEDCVFLNISHKESSFIRERFPGIYRECLKYGIDITKESIPVVPAAHYLCGGVLVDTWGNSSLEGLMALGETACTGLHGANRLASNSLLEAVVFAEKAATYCKTNKQSLIKTRLEPPVSDRFIPVNPLDEKILINHNWDVLRRTMWNYVGIVRNSKRLELARQRIINMTEEIEDLCSGHEVTPPMAELRNIAHVSLMIIESALLRKESRGLHYSTDYPESYEDQRLWTVLSRNDAAKPWEFNVVHKSFAFEK
jgi:L-aspartate oxidase